VAKAAGTLGAFASGVLMGMAAGYVLALLLAPQEGTDARTRLLDVASSVRQAPAQVAGEVQGRIQAAVEEGRRAASETRDSLEATAGYRAPAPQPSRPPEPSAI
jgi:gas vesicle protein